MSKIGAIIQARVSSMRLPGKVLRDLPKGSSVTVLEHVVRRIKRSKEIDDVIVATTQGKDDNHIVDIAKKEAVKYFTGSNEDVLSRYYLSARENELDVVVRICGDSPCIDPDIVDLIIKKHVETKADYTSNLLKQTFPRGFEAEIFNFAVLEKAYKNATKKDEKEHVTPYIYKNPAIFKIIQVEAPKELFAPDIRLVLDTEEDYTLLCEVFKELYPRNEYFSALEVINFFKSQPIKSLKGKKK